MSMPNLGRYRLIEPAGIGGMAHVWRAWDEVLGRRVAVKILDPELEADPDFVRRLHIEAHAVAQINHPHITAVYDFGQDVAPDGRVRPFVVMEFVEGATLRDVVPPGKAIAWREAAAIVSQIADALAGAHSRGIVHRDVSSANIMLTATGVKVLDFGLAAAYGQADMAVDGLVGTPAFIAPERLAASPAPVTPAVDVYSLGVVWYRMLAGRLPTAGADTVSQQLRAHLHQAPPPLPPVKGMPGALAALCMRCLDKDPSGRPTAAELVTRIRAVAGGVALSTMSFSSYAGQETHTSLLPWDTPADPLPGPSANPVPRRSSLRPVTVGAAAGFAVAGAVLWGLSGFTAGPIAFSPAPPTGQTVASPPVMRSPVAPSPVASSPAPSGAASAPERETATTSVRALGGTVMVQCRGDDVVIIDAIATTGFVVKDLDSGPAKESQAVFASAGHESEIKTRCEAGRPTSRIKES